MKKFTAATLIVLILSGASFYLWFKTLSGVAVRVGVAQGASARHIARTLKENDLILSEKLFLAFVRLTGSAADLKPGEYEFSQKDFSLDIIKALKEGPRNFVRVTVPEGSHIRQTAEILERSGIISSAAEFVEIAEAEGLEGYLMPETYVVSPNVGARAMIRTMRAEFDRKVTPEMFERAAEIGMSMEDVVILASIVEREAVVDFERPKVARVFLNRLARGQRLESCATIQYALGENRPRILYRDLEIDSPYNTYRHAGLPPGPIASPGIASVRAVLWPAEVDYLYFVARGDGTHLFGKTFDEHRRNIARVRDR